METHRQLDRDLDHLRDRLLLLGGETETAFRRAIHSLVERDSEEAEAVLKDDDIVDGLEVEIDRLCVDIIALRQPA
ncbi:MAG TPA: PhoU domain-containing protein, partial [Pyrinomonadaceae bacterium]|nr:PhoU domain-containing protein [Pyrinomonadaceae bacterium]